MARKTDDRKLEQLVIRLTKTQTKQLRERSKQIDIPISCQIRQAVDEYLLLKEAKKIS